MRRFARSDRGFTLIELLVVVSVLAILISILLPALGQARGAANSIVCSNMQRQLAVGMTNYATENDGWFPGINSSGMILAANGTAPSASDIERLNRSSSPVQTFDWISPSIGGDSLPTERNARFYALLEQMACPAMSERAPVFFGTSVDGGGADGGASAMQTYITNNTPTRPARGISYLMPLTFQLCGYNSFRAAGSTGVRYTSYGQQNFSVTATQARIADNHRPTQSGLQNPSRKIACADGFRYFDPATRTVDFDPSYKPSIYGSFCSGTPIFEGDISYGRSRTFGGVQLPLTYRHQGGINAAFWDGHVNSYKHADSFDPGLWYPTGSTFTAASSSTAPEAFRYYQQGDRLN